MTLIMLRLIIATFLLFIFAIATGKFQKLQLKDLKWFLILAFFEPYIYFVGETYGLTLVDSTTASVIVSTIPLFAPVLAYIVLNEKISRTNALGILISLVGVYFLVYEKNTNLNTNSWGVTLSFVAVFAGICYAITLRKIPLSYSAINIVLYQSLIGLIFFVPTFLITDFHTFQNYEITSRSIVALLLLAVFASVIAFVLFASSIRKLGVAKSNAFVNLIPVFTAIFSWLILDEVLTTNKWLGISIVVFGLYISQWKKNRLKEKI
jgi:drug/metabolite transporter (DMT)-like permease